MPYPTVQEVVERLDFEPEAALKATMQGYLDDLIVEACYIGRKWNAFDMPNIVAKAIRNALIRFVRRPDGYIQSRAGDETLIWSEENDPGEVGVPRFTRDEIAQIRDAALGGRSSMNGLSVVRTTPHGTTSYDAARSEPTYLGGAKSIREVPTRTAGEVSYT